MRILLAILWAILLVLAAWGLAVGLLLATPQELAMLLGFAGFMLLGSRLVWGYGAIGAFAEAIGRGENPDRAPAEAGSQQAEAEKLSIETLLGFWLVALDPYRYAFMAVYVLLFLISLALKLVLPVTSFWSLFTGSSLIEGVFWGASVAALLVWALGAVAAEQVAELAKKSLADAG